MRKWKKLNLTTERNMIDRESLNVAQEKVKKKVHFEDEVEKNEEKETLKPEQKYD